MRCATKDRGDFGPIFDVKLHTIIDRTLITARCGGAASSIGGVVGVGDAVRQYLQYLVVERGLAANTVEAYERDLRRYAEVLGARGKR